MTNYSTEHSIETTASPEAIWQLFIDVPNWKRWDAGIEQQLFDVSKARAVLGYESTVGVGEGIRLTLESGES